MCTNFLRTNIQYYTLHTTHHVCTYVRMCVQHPQALLKLTLIWSISFFKKSVTSIKFLAICMYPSWPTARSVDQEAAMVPPAGIRYQKSYLIWETNSQRLLLRHPAQRKHRQIKATKVRFKFHLKVYTNKS